MHPHRPGTTINTTSLWCACKHLCNQANICADRCVCKSNCYLHTRNPEYQFINIKSARCRQNSQTNIYGSTSALCALNSTLSAAKTSLHIKIPWHKGCTVKGFRRKKLRFSILPHRNQVCTCTHKVYSRRQHICA